MPGGECGKTPRKKTHRRAQTIRLNCSSRCPQIALLPQQDAACWHLTKSLQFQPEAPNAAASLTKKKTPNPTLSAPSKMCPNDKRVLAVLLGRLRWVRVGQKATPRWTLNFFFMVWCDRSYSLHPPAFNVAGCAVGLCICLLTPICSDKREEQRDGTCLTMVSGVMAFCIVCVCV